VPTVLAFVAFCVVASGGYLLNDVKDADSDRHHPTKRHRPIAAGEVSVRAAVIAGVAMLLLGLALAFAVDPLLGVTVGAYAVLTGTYTVLLRRVELFDLAAVAALFVIRVVAGGVAADVPLSGWFLVVVCSGAFFVVACKRAGERVELAAVGAEERRPTLSAYPEDFLRQMRTVSSGVALVAYCLWAFEPAQAAGQGPWSALSIAPFAMFVLRYSLLVERGAGGAPEELVFSDGQLRGLAAAWLVLFGLGVYLGA
jgi:decaprenyl-phosphate phosphoribosyltransferase